MKKQTAVVVSFSALLTLSAFAPKVLWQEDHNVNRFPASKEDTKPEGKKLEEMRAEGITPPKKSLYEMRELTHKVEAKKEEAQVSCLKDKQQSALEDEIKKLMADKEAIMLEIADLKKPKKEEAAVDKSEVPRFTEKQDFASLISQMTSLMITQQQQQMMLMQQMFTMMNQMQAPQMQHNQSPYNPYSFGVDQFDASAFQIQPTSEFGPRFAQLGQNLSQVQPEANPYMQQRAPSAQYEAPYSFNMGDMMNIQPAIQMQNPVNPSTDFITNNNVMDMQRVSFQ
ncbi:hypothetical protein SHI21_12420 [Bacteriovorax sp. PP10]|uniref:Uncharacterized protein n=1 Tax=Bacteriovorax antarcticus TaxID=3088717 RepID=A0ABU5VYD0_9BACT|nr:hypothetical protein [Bacteriovorax sp. PP10]MEA9357020.1 hypothetical protein [Bacteriovorax sp. PP10]